ncbi:hypothetical protein [Novosphingobium sp. KA1]|jgi:hypothetical protein|nr:hypothetical protein [Novosphingobium sp. KA1]
MPYDIDLHFVWLAGAHSALAAMSHHDRPAFVAEPGKISVTQRFRPSPTS